MVLAAANTYLGLFAGLTIATAIPAAVVSMAVLRLFGGGHILENNIVQTGASAGSSIAAGVIFTMPALVIIGYWQDFKYSWVLAIAGLGGVLGVLFSVPLRRSLIVEQHAARFRKARPRRKCSRPARIRAGHEDPRDLGRCSARWPSSLAQSGLRMMPDNAAGGRLHRQGLALHGHESVAGAARRRLHRRPQHRHRRRRRQRAVVEHRDSDLHAFFLDGDPALGRRCSEASAQYAA